MKRCSSCHQHLASSEFGNNRAQMDGLQNQCRNCRKVNGANYYAKKMGRPIKKRPPPSFINCTVCNRLVRVIQCRVGIAKYCSVACANIGHRSVPAWSRGFTKATHSSVLLRSQRLSERRTNDPLCGPRNPFFGKHHSIKWKIEHSAKRRGVPMPNISAALKLFYRKHPDKHPNRIMASNGHESALEKRLRSLLESMRIDYAVQFPICGFFADFAIVSKKLILEADGEYWHDPVHDAYRDAIIQRSGWTVLRFSEQEIRSNLDTCRQRIKTAVT